MVVNLKLFRNGKLQLCGLSENDGYLSLKLLKKELNNIAKKQDNEVDVLENVFKNKSIVKKIVDKFVMKRIVIY